MQIQIKAIAGHKGAIRAMKDYAEFAREGIGDTRVIFVRDPEQKRDNRPKPGLEDK